MNIAEKIRNFLKSNVGFIMVIIVSLAFIATGLITMENTGKTFWQIVADGAISLIFGISTNRFFDLQGILKGESDERYTKTVELHGTTVEKITPHIDKLDDWCDTQNKQTLKMQREKILIGVGLRYANFFDDAGVVKNFDLQRPPRKDKVQYNAWKKKYSAYKRTLRLKLTQLTASTLTSEGVKSDDPNYLGRTKQEYEKRTASTEIIWKILTAAFFGYYTFRFVQEIDYGLLIGTILQVSLYLFFGVLKLYSSFVFIVDEYRQRIIKKIDNLEKFYCYVAAMPSNTATSSDTNTKGDQQHVDTQKKQHE